jgi:hypothetical protein
MTDEPSPAPTPAPGDTERGFTINEDWAATVIGLVLVVLILTGVISHGILQ